ncbi:hypothetical protein AHiyo4_17040 [Arthrobacter sp. Hiyo4]|nr:hypothetical protein AHiyo4_17040 [Arthrobacter sp. Hiyo4]
MPEPSGDELTGQATLAGFTTSGSRKCASNAAAPGLSRLVVSSTMIRACCQEIVPACSADKVRGSLVVSWWASANSARQPVRSP